MLYTSIFQCPICGYSLKVDVSYCNADGTIYATKEDIYPSEAEAMHFDNKEVQPQIMALYCPEHRILFKP